MRTRAAASVLALAALLAGCEDVVDAGGGPGTFTLVEANGDPLPAVVFDDETEFGHLVATATSGSITLRESTYTQRIVVEVTLDGQPTGGDEPIVVSGDYEADGQLLTFFPDRAGSVDFTGTLSGDVLTTLEQDPDFGELALTWQR